MSHLIRHSLTAEPVLLAPERGERPGAWGASGEASPERCPFCPGNEEETPPELSRRDRDGAWRTRVVPNKYPAFGPIDGVPSHEVLIDTPDHASPLEGRNLEDWRELLDLWRDRVAHHIARPRIESVLVFRNEGRSAGQSIAHPHSQLLALPFTPPRLEQESLTLAEEGQCPLCSEVAGRDQNPRAVTTTDDACVVVCPQAPRMPYEMWIVPRQHHGDWYAYPVEPLATALRTAIRALRARWPEVPFNLALLASAASATGRDDRHWHLEVLPRLTNIAGFELATGAWMNIVEPERAAAELRASIPA